MSNVDEAIILAGGKGTRLRSVTMNEFPKGLTKIQGKPILQWEIEWLAREGVEHVVIAIGHLGEQIESYFGGSVSTSHGDIQLSYNHEQEKLGSGGAIKEATQYLKTDHFFILNGDVMCDIALGPMKEIHFDKGVDATMLTIQLRSSYGIVESKENMISKFVEKPLLPVYIHGGLDIINYSIVDRFPDRGQMEDTIFVELAENNNFGSYSPEHPYFWESVDTEKDFKNVNRDWKGLD